MSSVDPTAEALNGKKEAVKTYLEQTKVLISLSSAFVVAPAAAITTIQGIDQQLFLWSEIAFVLSAFLGYVVFATIAGKQHQAIYDVHDGWTRFISITQISSFIFGLAFFIAMMRGANLASKNPNPNNPPVQNPAAVAPAGPQPTAAPTPTGK